MTDQLTDEQPVESPIAETTPVPPARPRIVEVIEVGPETYLFDNPNFYIVTRSMTGKDVSHDTPKQLLQWFTMRSYHENPMTASAQMLHEVIKSRSRFETMRRWAEKIQGDLQKALDASTAEKVVQVSKKNLAKAQGYLDAIIEYNHAPASSITDLLSGVASLNSESTTSEYSRLIRLANRVITDLNPNLHDIITPDV